MKHEKERERVGEITDTADIKTQQGDTARQAAQHRQIAEEPKCAVGPHNEAAQAATLLNFSVSLFISVQLIIFK